MYPSDLDLLSAKKIQEPLYTYLAVADYLEQKARAYSLTRMDRDNSTAPVLVAKKMMAAPEL